MDKYDIINILIKSYGYKSMLQVKGEEMSEKIPLDIYCYKTSVPKAAFDIIYLAEPLSEPLLKDLELSLGVLNENGSIIIPNVNPQSSSYQIKNDSWRAWVTKRTYDFEISQEVVDIPNGLGIIRRGNQVPWTNPGSHCFNYYYLNHHRESLLNLVSTDEFERNI